jgi:hypothetical protein
MASPGQAGLVVTEDPEDAVVADNRAPGGEESEPDVLAAITRSGAIGVPRLAQMLLASGNPLQP